MNRVEQLRHQRPALPFYLLTVLALLLAQGQVSSALAQQWETNGNNINNTNTGNVGVGTTTPTSPLEVQAPHSSITLSQAGVTGKVTLQTTFGRDLHLNANARWSGMAWERFDATMPSWNLTVSSVADHFSFRRAAPAAGSIGWTELFRITNTGSVGIGTHVPAVFLGDTANSGAGAAGAIGTTVNIQSNPGYSILRLTNSAAGWLEMGRITFGSPAYTGAEKRTAVIISGSDSPSTADPSGKLVFYTSNAGTMAERLRISPVGDVGIGTANPAHKLDVFGNVNASVGLCIANNCKTSWDQVGGSQWTTSGSNVFYNTGNVGVGTSAPGSKLFVGAGTSAITTLPGLNVALGGNSYVAASNGIVNTFIGSDTSAYGIVGTLSNHPLGLRANNILALTVMPAGNVGVGTTAPAHKLDVAGNVNASGLCLGGDCKTAWSQVGGTPSQWATSGANISYSDGSVGVGTTEPTEKLHVVGNIHVTGNINAKYQDVAEWVPSTQSLAAGTVVVLDTTRPNHVVASSSAYDTRVAGVVSARPGVLLGERGEGKLMVATTGRVRVKVDATRGPVRVGDLLVTSDREGVAMKSEPVAVGDRPMHLPGTLIGKALEPLAGDVGEILVLLSLQ
jgi:hypothetical protein